MLPRRRVLLETSDGPIELHGLGVQTAAAYWVILAVGGTLRSRRADYSKVPEELVRRFAHLVRGDRAAGGRKLRNKKGVKVESLKAVLSFSLIKTLKPGALKAKVTLHRPTMCRSTPFISETSMFLRLVSEV